jgi:hypothetical protein
MAKSRKSNRFDGCTFTFFVGMVTVALFVANGILIRAFFSPSLEGVDARIYQPLQFGLPIVMIFIEFWLFDRFRRLFEKRK